MKTCDYGCGQKAKYSFNNGKSCCSENYQSCQSLKEKNRKSNIGQIRSQETKDKMKFKSLERWSNPENRKKISGSGNPFYGKKHKMKTLKKISKPGELNPFYGKTHTEVTKKTISELNRGNEPWNKGKTNVYSDESIRKMSISQKGKRLGADHPRWLGGDREYPDIFNHFFKSIIKNRDENKCQNINCKGNTKILHVHHINYIKEDCSYTNLITLCRDCHIISNNNRNQWENYYKRLLFEKI